MHSVLAISEVLAVIFQFTTTTTDSRCAQVHRAWKEDALDALWYRIDGLDALVTILGPTRINEAGQLCLVGSVPQEKWTTFDSYAARIKHVNLLHQRGPMVDLGSLDILGSSRHAHHLFPALRALSVTSTEIANHQHVVQLFLHPGLGSFTIETDASPLASGAFFDYVHNRCPEITHLNLISSGAFVHAFQERVVRLIQGLPRLECAELPSAALTEIAQVADALRRSPNLRMFRCKRALLLSPSAHRTEPPLLNAQFRRLTELSIHDELPPLTKILQSSFRASVLRKLYVGSAWTQPSNVVRTFFIAVGEQCCMLEDLSLVYLPGSVQLLPDRHGLHSIHSTILRPLRACVSMVHFQLNTPFPFVLTDGAVKDLVSCWPFLRSCELNCGPFMAKGNIPDLTLLTLNTFARLCPNIESLSILVNPTSLPPQSARTPFGHLRVLNIALSRPIAHAPECARLLAEITGAYCVVSHHQPAQVWQPASDRDILRLGLVSRQTEAMQISFSAVLSLVPSMSAVHAQYRDQLRGWARAEADNMERISALEEKCRTLEERFRRLEASGECK